MEAIEGCGKGAGVVPLAGSRRLHVRLMFWHIAPLRRF